MKLIIAGSRSFNDYRLLCETMSKVKSNVDIIVSGHANGADTLGEQYAKDHNIELIVMPANWAKYGKSAGPRRNQEMAEYADNLLAFWDGESKGTSNMIDLAKRYKLGIWVVNYTASKLGD